jgi:hypothetical protein
LVSLETMERDYILQVLERTGWVIEGELGAAAILDLESQHPAFPNAEAQYPQAEISGMNPATAERAAKMSIPAIACIKIIRFQSNNW